MPTSPIHQAWEPNKVMLPRDTTVAAVLGAPVAWNGTTVVSAAEFTWTTNEATTRKNFARQFAGNLAQEAGANEVIFANGDAFKASIRVDTAGVVTLNTVATGSYAVGTLLGPKKDSGDALLNNSYTIVTDPEEATHRVVYTPAATDPAFVHAQILSRGFPPVPITPAFPVFAVIAGGSAGDLTVTGIATTDQLVAVIRLDRDATAANINLGNLTSEFSITAANTINNSGGTATTGDALMVVYCRR
jgi:hypothetical protein